MYKKFEGFTEAFPKGEPIQPPTGILAFCRHYTRGFEKPLILLGLMSMTIAIIEVALFGYMGQLVDWLSTSNPDTFLADNQSTLMGLGILLLVVMPILISVYSLLLHQTLLGNYPMSIRWLAHRYLLKQSLSFYQDDFAGRVATKVMQTSLAVRETVTKMVDVFVLSLIHI